ncbi:MAG TPA: DUF5131 family protein, partial [Firmicutes bacterium]|nr:DUF5131 family protein [Bacillota bacterium]
GCANCYAAGFKVTLHPERLNAPLRLRKASRIFVNSMSDLFHEAVPIEFITRVFNVTASATADCGKHHRHQEACWGGEPHTFLVLTKRPARMKEVLEQIPELVADWWPGDAPLSLALDVGDWPLPNVWLGVSVEDQARADQRIPLLLQTPAAVRLVSLEPLLGPVDLYSVLTGERLMRNAAGEYEVARGPRLDWLIIGAETGPGARPCDPAWVQSIVDQAREAGVPVFVKGPLARQFPIQEHPEVRQSA